MKSKIYIFIALASIIFLSSCCSTCRVSNSKAKKMLTQNQWSVKSISGVNEKFSSTENIYTLNFNSRSGEFDGLENGNKYFGSYNTFDRSGLKLTPKGTSKYECDSDFTERKFMETLSVVDEFAFDETDLVLLNNGEVVMVFRSISRSDKIKNK
ncbi:MAG: META domain-containing protein [Bacteroidetes bacterium]|nr:META domain-containing protein [Bacteroidota bacterium]